MVDWSNKREVAEVLASTVLYTAILGGVAYGLHSAKTEGDRQFRAEKAAVTQTVTRVATACGYNLDTQQVFIRHFDANEVGVIEKTLTVHPGKCSEVENMVKTLKSMNRTKTQQDFKQAYLNTLATQL